MANGRSVFITGAATGIGQATALRLDKIGFRVFAGVLPGEDTAPLTASGQITPVVIDVTDAGMIAAARETIEKIVGESGLYGLFNNAGIAVTGPIEFLPMEAIRRQLEVNLFGHIAVTQAFLPLIRKARGRIVNTVSILGRVVTPGAGPYAMSKFAMEAFTDTLRLELRPWAIQVSAIEPGAIATPLWDRVREVAEELAAEMPPQAHELYGGLMRGVRNSNTNMVAGAILPDEVAKAVAHALTAERPKTRYLVGKDAKRLARLRWLLPDHLFDRTLLGSRRRR